MKLEFFKTAMRKKVYTSIDALQGDLDEWLLHYNYERPHSGKRRYGKTPTQTFEDSKKLTLGKNNEVLYLDYTAEQKSQNFDDNIVP